jgi:capsular polysaccharide biosynthesis protein
VIEKVLEAFFRHAMLIILPAVVLPLVVVAWVLATPPQYEAQAGVWVERPAYLSYSGDELTRYLPPATVQRNRLTELMRTRSFLSDVVKDTPLAGFLAFPGGQVSLDQIFARDFEITQSGDHLLVIRFRAEESDAALTIVNAVVEQFRDRATDDRRAQAQLAISFYEARLTDADGTLASARTELAKYLDANPAIATTLTRNGLDVARLDPGFADLQRRVDAGLRYSDSARTALQSAQFDYASSVQGDALGFRIVDAAGVSATPSRQIRKVLVYPLAALIGGVLVSAALLMLFALSDHSVRSLADLAPDSVILGVVPRMRPARVGRRAGADLTRRAVGYIAGATLPLKPSERKAS